MRKFCSYCRHEYFADEIGDCPFCGSYNYDDDENFIFPEKGADGCPSDGFPKPIIFGNSVPAYTPHVVRTPAPFEIDDDLPF